MTDPFEAYERRIFELERENDRLTEERDALRGRVEWLDGLLELVDPSFVRDAFSLQNLPPKPGQNPGLDTGNSLR
jgi:hypothetical protein